MPTSSTLPSSVIQSVNDELYNNRHYVMTSWTVRRLETGCALSKIIAGGIFGGKGDFGAEVGGVATSGHEERRRKRKRAMVLRFCRRGRTRQNRFIEAATSKGFARRRSGIFIIGIPVTVSKPFTALISVVEPRRKRTREAKGRRKKKRQRSRGCEPVSSCFSSRMTLEDLLFVFRTFI